MSTIRLTNGINGTDLKAGVNGVHGLVGKSKAVEAVDASPQSSDDDYDYPPNGGYLEGYTMDQILQGRQISDPYAWFTIPPFAHINPLRLDSFRAGHKPTVEDLRSELTMTFEGQTPFAEIIDRVVQHSYENLTEMAEVMPSFNDRQRKEKIIEWAVSTRKLIIKTYAIANWARVASDVQIAMDIHGFLARCEAQISQIPFRLELDSKGLIMKKRRNADLLNAVDILSTGTYRRLPTILKEIFEDPKPISNANAVAALEKLDYAISHRLRFHEIIPAQMHKYRVSEGRVWFEVPDLFEVCFTLSGPEPNDYWRTLDLRFLLSANPSQKDTVKDYPANPFPGLKRQIIELVDSQLHLNLLPPEEDGALPRVFQLAEIADAPFIRAFNLLQILSLTYQLEIMHAQVQTLMTLGWADYLKLDLDREKRSMAVSYWKRFPPKQPGKPNPNTPPQASYGGTLTVSIESNVRPTSPERVSQLHVDSLKDQLQRASIFQSEGGHLKRPSNALDQLGFTVKWSPSSVMNITLKAEETTDALKVDAQNLDFPSMIRQTIQRHELAILRTLRRMLLERPTPPDMFIPAELDLVEEGHTGSELRIRLHGSQTMVVSIDHRSGTLSLSSIGDFSGQNPGHRLEAVARMLNQTPHFFAMAIIRHKSKAIQDDVIRHANYLGLHQARLNFPPQEISKLGNSIIVQFFVSLKPYPGYYLAMLGFSNTLKWALINVGEVPNPANPNLRSLVINDVGMLDWKKISRNGKRLHEVIKEDPGVLNDQNVKSVESLLADSWNRVHQPKEEEDRSFNIRSEVLRELYAFCCARVSHTKVEQQLKSHGIPCESIFPSSKKSPKDLSLDYTSLADDSSFSPYSSIVHSVPIIWVRAKDLSKQRRGDDEVAYENVKIKVIDWWTERQSKVVTSIKLRYSQPLSGSAGMQHQKGTNRAFYLEHPTQKIIYDPVSSVVSFISDNVETCVDEFLDEWHRVQRVVSIVQAVGKAKSRCRWNDVRILSFDLRRVEFVYHSVYSVSIQWDPMTACNLNQTAPSQKGRYCFTFGTLPSKDGSGTQSDNEINPHVEIATFLSRRLDEQSEQSIESAVEGLLLVLRNTLGVVKELKQIKTRDALQVSLFVKSSSWFRLLYGSKHAIDFRVLRDGRAMILDVARSLFSARPPAADMADTSRNPLSPFQPIDRFDDLGKHIARDVGKTQIRSRSKPETFPPTVSSAGSILCRGDVASKVISLLHMGVLASLLKPGEPAIKE